MGALNSLKYPFRRLIVWLFVGVSPVGIVIPYFILSQIEICGGSLATQGINCDLPLIGDYLEFLATLFYGSCYLFGLCFLWTIIAVFTWLIALLFFIETVGTLFASTRPD